MSEQQIRELAEHLWNTFRKGQETRHPVSVKSFAELQPEAQYMWVKVAEQAAFVCLGYPLRVGRC
jgi:hypothetical protein